MHLEDEKGSRGRTFEAGCVRYGRDRTGERRTGAGDRTNDPQPLLQHQHPHTTGKTGADGEGCWSRESGTDR